MQHEQYSSKCKLISKQQSQLISQRKRRETSCRTGHYIDTLLAMLCWGSSWLPGLTTHVEILRSDVSWCLHRLWKGSSWRQWGAIEGFRQRRDRQIWAREKSLVEGGDCCSGWRDGSGRSEMRWVLGNCLNSPRRGEEPPTLWWEEKGKQYWGGNEGKTFIFGNIVPQEKKKSIA